VVVGLVVAVGQVTLVAASAEPLTSEVVSVDFTHRVRLSLVHALEWEPAEAEWDSVWVGTHHISQRRHHLSAQLQADRRIRLRILMRLGALIRRGR
jgi:hypothetical protein